MRISDRSSDGCSSDLAVRASFRDEVWVRGEIHDLSRPASGHVYLTLVEARSDGSKACLSVMLSAAAKVGVNRALTRAGGAVRMVDGTEVRIRGRLDWYSPRGQLPLRMTAIAPASPPRQPEVPPARPPPPPAPAGPPHP